MRPLRLLFGSIVSVLGALGRAGRPAAAPEPPSETIRRINERLIVAGLRAQVLAEEADAERRRLAFLSEASRQLAASLDYETTLATLARLSVPEVADRCLIDLAEPDGTVQRAAVSHSRPGEEATLRQLVPYAPEHAGGPHPLRAALTTGKPQLVGEVHGAWLASVARDADELARFERLAPRSILCVPLAAHGRVLGAMTFVAAESGRHYGPRDLPVAEELARRAAAAIDHARLYREMQEAVRARDDFLARASHELRTPVTVVRGHLALLERRPESPSPESAAAVAIARRHVDRLVHLVDDLFDASRLGAAALFRPEYLDMRAVASDAIARVEPLARRQGVRLTNAVQEGLSVAGERRKLVQVVVNLVTNAVKYTAPGGKVQVDAEPDKGSLELRVRDTGEGIQREHLEKVFEPFFQVGSARGRRKAPDRGTGLGLAVVRRFVALHRGHVRAESAGPGRGSTFVVRLPAEPRPEPHRSAST